MQLLLLTLCLVGLGQAGPTARSNFTDPLIRALYAAEPDPNVYPLKFVLWGEEGGNNGKTVMKLCGGTVVPEIDPTKNPMVARVRIWKDAEAGVPENGKDHTYTTVTRSTPDTNCIKITNAFTKPSDGANMEVIIMEARTDSAKLRGNEKKYFVGTLKNVPKVTITSSKNVACPKSGTISLVFDKTPEDENLKGKCLGLASGKDKKNCIFVPGNGVVTLEDNSKKVCINSESDMKYCHEPAGAQLKKNKDLPALKITSLQYGKELVLNKELTDPSKVQLWKYEGDKPTPLKCTATPSDAKVVKITKPEDLKPSDFKYTVCDTSDSNKETADLQDISFKVDKLTINGEEHWTFDFLHIYDSEDEGKQLYTATAITLNTLLGDNFNEIDVDCSNIEKDNRCYGFLRPDEETHLSIIRQGGENVPKFIATPAEEPTPPPTTKA